VLTRHRAECSRGGHAGDGGRPIGHALFDISERPRLDGRLSCLLATATWHRPAIAAVRRRPSPVPQVPRVPPAPRRFVWNPTVRIDGRRRVRWACDQAAFEPVHMSTGLLPEELN
jgi:hypothetical protein